jgi:hypothetical protein
MRSGGLHLKFKGGSAELLDWKPLVVKLDTEPFSWRDLLVPNQNFAMGFSRLNPSP